jgi:hypothetical protein
MNLLFLNKLELGALHKYYVGNMIFMIYQPIRAWDIYYSLLLKPILRTALEL